MTEQNVDKPVGSLVLFFIPVRFF